MCTPGFPQLSWFPDSGVNSALCLNRLLDLGWDPRSLYSGEYPIKVAHLLHSLRDGLIYKISLDWDIRGPNTKGKMAGLEA